MNDAAPLTGRAGDGGESGTPIPYAAIAQKQPKNKDSRKARPNFVTTAVYHRDGHFGRQSRTISRRLRSPVALTVALSGLPGVYAIET